MCNILLCSSNPLCNVILKYIFIFLFLFSYFHFWILCRFMFVWFVLAQYAFFADANDCRAGIFSFFYFFVFWRLSFFFFLEFPLLYWTVLLWILGFYAVLAVGVFGCSVVLCFLCLGTLDYESLKDAYD